MRPQCVRAALAIFFSMPFFPGFAQPHYAELGSLPVPTASERTEVFDPQTRTWFSFPSYNQGDLTGVYKAAHGDNGNLPWVQCTSYPGPTTYWGRGATDGKNVYFTGTIDNVSKFAAIQVDATLGAWQEMTGLPTPAGGRGRALHQSFVYSGRLYVIGGWHGDGLPAYADAYYAPILSSGAVGAFTQTTSLPVGMVGHSATVSPDGNVYIANFTNVFLGRISADGSISSWAKQTTIPGMNHNNYGNVGIALLPNHLIIVDATSTFVCRLDDSGQVIGLETTITNPAIFNQRSAYTIDGKVFVAATSGKLYRIEAIEPKATWDDFTGGLGTWSLTPDWSLKTSPSGTPVLAANTQADRFAWKTNITLATSWAVETTVQLSALYNDGGTTGTAGFALGGTNLNLLALADVIYSHDGWIYPGVGYWTGSWNDSLDNHPWVSGATNLLTLRLERQPGRKNLTFTITSQTGLRREYISHDIPDAIWNQVQRVGLRTFKANTEFSYFSVESPIPSTLLVDARANLFGAGHATPPAPVGAGAGLLPPYVLLGQGERRVLTFSSVTGTVHFSNGLSNDPDGNGSYTGLYYLPYGGISGLTNLKQFGYLAGVFLGDAEPKDPAPPALDFTDGRGIGRSFASLAPELNQTFFIGDGLTGTNSGATQQFIVPDGATRLFLGFIDSIGPGGLPGYYGDNSGSVLATFRVEVKTNAGDPLIITSQPQGQMVKAGDTLTLSVTASGAKPVHYQWLKDETTLIGATAANLLLSNVTTNDTGNYKVVVSNDDGSVTSAAANVQVEVFAPAIIVQPLSQTVLENADVKFSVQATAAPSPTYQWQFNGINLAGENGRTLSLANVSTNDAGNYKVVVSNFISSITSQPASLTVRPVLNLAQAVSNPSLFWQSGGDLGWIAQTNVTHNGIVAAQSGDIEANQKSRIGTSVAGPGTLTFWWKVSSESGFDKLVFSVNGTNQGAISGESDWLPVSFNLTTGLQTLAWEYAKDGSSSSGSDKCWLSEISYIPAAGIRQPMYLFASRRTGYRLFQMTLIGEANRKVNVEYSDNLSTWNLLNSITNDMGTMTIFDPGASSSAHRAYRATSP